MKFPTLLGHGAKAEESGETKPRLDVADLREKLDTAEERIRGLINVKLPEVQLELPRLSLSEAFRGDGFAPLPNTAEEADLESGDLRKDLLEAQMADPSAKAQEFIVGVQTELLKAKNLAVGVQAELRAPLLTAVSSLALVTASALVGMGPFLATMVTALASTSSVAFLFYQRSMSVRSRITGHLDSATQMVLDAMGRATQTVARLLTQLTEAIDDMVEQQQPALDKIEELESTLQVDIPDPGDLKQPLEDCESKIDGYLSPLVQECRDMIDQLLSASRFTQVVMDSRLFFMLTVTLPTMLVLVCNMSVALVQLWACLTPPAPSDLPVSQSINATVDHLSDVPSRDISVPPAGVAGIEWHQYLHPWMSQMFALAVQVFIGILVTQEARVCASVNAFISSMEEQMSSSINASIADVASTCFEDAFSQVRERCDAFFPKFKDILERVEQAENLAQKAGMIANVASAFKW